MERKNKIFVIAVTLCLGVCVAAYLAYSGLRVLQQNAFQRRVLAARAQAWQGLQKTLEAEIAGFHGESAVIVKDLTFGWQYSYNKDKRFPAASVVKIPIMAACFYAAREGKLSPDETVVLREAHKTGGSGILKNIAAGTPFSVEKLIEIMITESDNTASNILISRLGFDYLNASFTRMGLRHTSISRKMMDFRCRKQGVENFTTAQDVAFLLERMYRRQFVSRRVSERCLEMLLDQKVNDRIPKKLPAELPVAHKTGLERYVCHDTGIVFTDAGDFLICVLTRSPQRARSVKNFIANLALSTYQNYERLPASRYSFVTETRRP
ncbi:MAG: class A beta-lactamase-related serine hydrolase [Candidatus Omnitrophica bacterium]|nr:class A beta-lactamase-related serine hydrolase [Candidatus Omnitrophota bacterium]